MSNNVSFNEIQKIIGYRKGLVPQKITNMHMQLGSEISNLPANTRTGLPTITLEEVLERSLNFYKNHFDLHDIPINKEITTDFVKNLNGIIDLAEITKATSLLSPYQLPISLVSGHSMVGDVSKIVACDPNNHQSMNVPFIFYGINLGNELTALSIATHIHEISHTQTESVLGYTEDYHNKEVISVFLEKVAALELDPLGNLLRTSERMRYRVLFEHLTNLYIYLRKPDPKNYNSVLESSMYIESTLKAEKLFDIYQNARKPKEKARILSAIQSVFDGQMTVEELLQKNQVTAAKGADLSLTRRHLSK